MTIYKIYPLILLLTSFYTSFVAAQSDVVINEFMASNGITIADEDGDFEDWIELYNTSDVAVDITGYYLSDKDSNPLRWRFPATLIPPNGYLLVFASGKNRFGSMLHTNFSISASGEPLILSDPDGKLLDYIPSTAVPRDISYGRYPDGSSHFEFFDFPTPGASNVRPFQAEVSFSHPSGFYSEAVSLFMATDDPDLQIFYTLNGDIPTPDDHLFAGSLFLDISDLLENNPIIYIPTNAENSDWWYRWRNPEENLFRAHVIRARAFENGVPRSEVKTATYFIDPEVENRFQLPVISVATPEDGLYDFDTGIFVPGRGFEENPLQGGFWTGGNFYYRGREWEREAAFFYFENGEPALEQNLGIRIQGSASRSLPQKSLRLYAREGYGKPEIEYPFFSGEEIQTFKRLLLRNGGQDFLRAYLTDPLTHLIVNDLDLESQLYQPAILFVNGAYWGIINIRERIDEHYFESRFGVQEEDLDLIGHAWGIKYEVDLGSVDDYLAIMDFLGSRNLSDQQSYEWVADQIDVKNFIDYYIGKMFFATRDWPGNNLDFWRDRSIDGKWRWIWFDNDDAFEVVDFNSYDYLTVHSGSDWPNPRWTTQLFRSLMENSGFRELFAFTVLEQLKTVYHPDRTLNIAQMAAENIMHEMPHHIERWRYPDNISQWENHLQRISNFLAQRPCAFYEMTLAFFEEDGFELNWEECMSNTNEEYVQSIRLFPNPTAESVRITLRNSAVIQSVRLFDLSGRLVYLDQRTTDISEQFSDIDLQSLKPGIYLLELTASGGDQYFGRVVKVE